MTYWQFDDSRIDILKAMISEAFLSYERDALTEGGAYGVLRLNFGNKSILLKNEEEEIAMFENEIVPYEEASKFTCCICDPQEAFHPGLEGVRVEKHEVNEQVIGGRDRFGCHFMP